MSAGPDIFPTRRIPLVELRRDGGTQVRAEMNAATVEDYAAALADGKVFPPVTAFHDGEVYWLADGFHRVLAHEKAGFVDVAAEVRDGSKRDALLFAVGANATHGLARSNKDKRRAVEILLRDEEWVKKYDVELADIAMVSSMYVGKVRRELVDSGDIKPFNIRQGSDGTARDTSKSGRKVKSTGQPAEDAPTKTTGQVAEEKIRAATTLDELDAAYQEASRANLSDREFEEIAEARQERGAELRKQAQTTAPAPAHAAAQPAPVEVPPPAPTPTPPRGQMDLLTQPSVAVFTQEPAPQPVSAETVTVSKAEWEALCQWRDSVTARAGAGDVSSVEKVMGLIALAKSSNEHEAASAALKACRMIRERGLLVATAVQASHTDEDLTSMFESMRQERVAFWERMRRREDEVFGKRRA